jgi:phosphoribosyl 1,2-cyclic phosphodiesterase
VPLTVRFWGTRGSIPTPGPGTVRYGGNTPCVELRTATNALIVLDLGTGARELGRQLALQANGDVVTGDLYVSHAHWDHIQGLPFFAPLFAAGNRFTIWGSRALETSIDRVVRDQMMPVVFPVRFEDLGAAIEFAEVVEGPVQTRDGYTVRAMPAQHPGGALALRFADGDDAPSNAGASSLVYVSDNELQPVNRYATPMGWRERLVDFCADAGVLVHDATYADDEYERHRGWGHSTFTDALRLAIDARVKRLVLFHHHPDRDDDALDRQLATCRAMAVAAGSAVEVSAAAEGMVLRV